MGATKWNYSDHILHANGDLFVVVEAAKEANNVRRVAFMQDDKFPHDLCSHNWLDIQCYQLMYYQHTLKCLCTILQIKIEYH